MLHTIYSVTFVTHNYMTPHTTSSLVHICPHSSSVFVDDPYTGGTTVRCLEGQYSMDIWVSDGPLST